MKGVVDMTNRIVFVKPMDNTILLATFQNGIEKTNDVKIQFLRYIFVGGIAAVVNIGSLYIFTDVFHLYYLSYLFLLSLVITPLKFYTLLYYP